MIADMQALTSIRARVVYWQKRIELEPQAARQQRLALFAWAEIGRLVMNEGERACNQYRGEMPQTLDQFKRLFEAEVHRTASRPKKRVRPRARVARKGK